MGVVNAPCGILEFTKGRLERKFHSCVGLENLAARAFQVVYAKERQKPQEEQVGYCEPQIN